MEPTEEPNGSVEQASPNVIKEKVMESNFQSIKESFAKLVLHIRQALEDLNIDIKDVCLVISNFPCSAKYTNILLFDKHREEVRNASSLRDLFSLLGDYQYWDWKNYNLLDAIVSIFGTDQLKEKVKQYEKELQAFYINIKLSSLADTTENGSVEKPDFVKLTAKVEKGLPWSEHTMQCVEEFWESFTEEYLLKKYTLFFHDAQPGCVCLTFLVPSAIAPHIIVESQSKSKFFTSKDIMKLTIGDQCVYQSSDKEVRQNQEESLEQKQLEEENESLREVVQILEQRNAKQQEQITELKAQQQLGRPVGAQSMEVNTEEECVAYNIENRSHFTWTLNLNGFFYSHIHSYDSDVLQSAYFTSPNGKIHYQVILSPRSFDKWANRHCSLFLVAYGNSVQFPTRAVLQCRLPGLQGARDVEQYFQFSGPNLLTQRKDIAKNCYLVSSIYTFLSYSFFMKHLNIIPFFQIVVDLSF